MKQLKLFKQSIPAIWVFLNIAIINPAIAQEKVLRTLTVTGEGVEKLKTTLTQVQVGVEIQGTTTTEVQENCAKQTSAVVDFLRSRNVSELQTTGIGLQTNYDYSNNQKRLLGYICSNTVNFRLKTEQVGNLLDEVVKAGATSIDGVGFMATEEAISSAQKSALKKATLDAQQQSEVVFKALNLTPKEIVSIQLNEASPPQPMLMGELRSSSTPVIGGAQTVSASVTLQISY